MEPFITINSLIIGKIKLHIRWDFSMKKILISGLILVMMSSALVGCGKNSDVSSNITSKEIAKKLIEADYLMKNHMEGKNLFLFLSNARDDSYFCRSFFPEEKMDYTKNQASWTLLYKKKRNLIDGSEHVLYDRLKKDIK